MADKRIKVAIVGYGVIGSRTATAIRLQSDMMLSGVADIATDWRIAQIVSQGIPLFAATAEARTAMEAAGLSTNGLLKDLVESSDIIVDCTPKHRGADNAELYRKLDRPFIVQGGEKHDVTGHSFVAETSYSSTIGRSATRVVSCNTTSIVRTLGALKNAGLLKKARGTLLRRATDPWESHLGGIMNTLVPEPEVPSHQGPDARLVDPDLDVTTIAVRVPETLAHLHTWYVEMARPTTKADVLDALSQSSRILLIDSRTGLSAINVVKEWMAENGRRHANLYEVAIWHDLLTVDGNDLYFSYMVDNQAIVIPETIDAIRALAGNEQNPDVSIAKTNESLAILSYPIGPSNKARPIMANIAMISSEELKVANTRRKIALKNKNDIVDEALRESFPASDPPAWTLGTDYGYDTRRKPGGREATRKPAKK